jgi:hypothetical protein
MGDFWGTPFPTRTRWSRRNASRPLFPRPLSSFTFPVPRAIRRSAPRCSGGSRRGCTPKRWKQRCTLLLEMPVSGATGRTRRRVEPLAGLERSVLINLATRSSSMRRQSGHQISSRDHRQTGRDCQRRTNLIVPAGSTVPSNMFFPVNLSSIVKSLHSRPTAEPQTVKSRLVSLLA